jgi:fatty-acyl-CoA synthase
MSRKVYDLSCLSLVGSGGASLSSAHKQELLERLPNAMVLDAIGSSETGRQGNNFTKRGSESTSGSFVPTSNTRILSSKLDRVLRPDEDEVGWLAQAGRVPLGYLDDAKKSTETFPAIEGRRWSVPGDRARYRPDGIIEVLGRDSITINSGGEKIFAEEVESALKRHPAVYDTIVCGRPSDRWGQEVVAIVQLRERMAATSEDLLEACREHIARYKLPKTFLFTEQIVRSPSGKPDYHWAKALASTR